jgi:hypothetical protein
VVPNDCNDRVEAGGGQADSSATAQFDGMVPPSALRKWRVEKRGPRFLKMGSLVRYRQVDVDVWLESPPTGGESGAPTDRRGPLI